MTKPYVVIIAGGSGTRLWPLSTPRRPKHLLTLAGSRSLLQATVDRVLKLTTANKIWVIPEKSHAAEVYKQLPDINKRHIIVEPGRRGTASCVLLGLAEITKSKLPDGPVIFLWADHFIRDVSGFCSSLSNAAVLAAKTKRLVFVGVEPSYPATGFNYMHKGAAFDHSTSSYLLDSFVEKPDHATATGYLTSGEYLWNAGYLVGTHSSVVKYIQTLNPRRFQDYQCLLEQGDHSQQYLQFSTEPVDEALSERVKDGLIVAANFDWADVGSFRDYYAVSTKDREGNLIVGESIYQTDTTNSLIRNDTDKPLAVIGLDNVVVVATDDGIAVMNKNFSQQIGDIAKIIQDK